MIGYINADQARTLQQESQQTQQERDHIILNKDVEDELQRITYDIICAAKENKCAVKEWIKYQETCTRLAVLGFVLIGGRVKANVPVNKVKEWGKQEDKVEISWGE